MPYPRTDAETVEWLNNVALKVDTYTPTFSWTPEQVASVKDDCAFGTYVLTQHHPTFKTAQQTATAFKTSMLNGPLGSPETPLPGAPVITPAPTMVQPGIMPRLKLFFRGMTTHSAYTQAIGADFSIQPANGGDANGEVAKPRRSADGSEGEWVLLGTDRFSPYVDNNPPLNPGRPE